MVGRARSGGYVQDQVVEVSEEELERMEKKGYDTGIKAIHPFTGAEVPLFIANFVLLAAVQAVTGVVFAAVARAVPPERRSVALGLTSAVGSLGQFMLPPIGQALLSAYGWQVALMLLAVFGVVVVSEFVSAAVRQKIS